VKKTWRDRFYGDYVSSGQAGDVASDAERQFAPRQPYVQRLIRHHIPADRNVSILDAGCGSGAYLYFLQKAGYKTLTGVDGSAEQVALAHGFGLTFVTQQDILSCLSSLEENSMDVLLLMDVLEHMTRQELLDVLDGAYRVLQPGGNCIAHVPNAAGLFGMEIRYGDLTHEIAFTPQSIRQVFTLTGFRHIQCFEDKPVIHGVISSLRRVLWEIGTIPARVLLAAETGGTSFVLSQNMLITAEKPGSRAASFQAH
jgi:SAM-dependent methyltransferase